MKKVLVAGCGLVGKTIALDLSQDFDVTVMDPSESSLASIDNPNIKKIRKSVTDADSLFEIAKDMDVVCGLVPQPFLKQLHTQIIDMGKNYVSPSGYRLSEGLDKKTWMYWCLRYWNCSWDVKLSFSKRCRNAGRT